MQKKSTAALSGEVFALIDLTIVLLHELKTLDARLPERVIKKFSESPVSELDKVGCPDSDAMLEGYHRVASLYTQGKRPF